jgi:glutamyl-tRNA synthetase
MTAIRTRFAPSPTGYIHIGGMRTALFNWLWARHNNGRFVLRIDDTDQQRNIDEALSPILQAFRWLELDWDEGPEVGGEYGPYFQSQRSKLYQQAVEKLLDSGKAYRCYESPQQTQADREAAEKEKRPYLNSRRSLELTDEKIAQLESEGRQPVIRFLVPRDEKVSIDDSIRGHVQWDCALIPDSVIMRADGSPLYNFATVVDDAQMQISHVIRAEEHLSNTPVQVLIHQALGNDLPQFAHIPYVAAPGTKEKLSKRDKKIEKYRKNPQFKKMFEDADRIFPQIGLGSSETLNPVMVEYYDKIGFLPEAVFNALSRLGWSLDDKTEIMSRKTIVENFTLDRVIKSPAGLDPDKLLSFQTHWMGEHPLEDKVNGCLGYLVAAGLVQVADDRGQEPEIRNQKSEVSEEKPSSAMHASSRSYEIDEQTKEFIGRLIEVIGDRLKVFSDILNFDDFLIADEELSYDEKAFDKRLKNVPESVELLRKFRDQLSAIDICDAETTDTLLHDFVETEGAKIGQVIHALRVAVTGKPQGPGMFDCLELLGKQRCLNRINRALGML